VVKLKHMNKPYISIIIPSYNEEKRISDTLKRVKEYMSSQDYPYEILVVIDGAKDKTAEISKSFLENWPELRVIDNKQNNGKGYVVRQGMLEAKGDYRVFTDADNSTDISHLEKMVQKFKGGFDIVMGTRDYKDAVGAKQAIPQSGFKRLLGNLGNLFIQILVVPGVWDTQAGFKGFSAQSAEKIFSQLKITRWGFDIEVWALARKFKYKITMIPIYWENNAESHVKASAYIAVLFETIKIRMNLWSGKYR
jgi:dolichyl-phosphate beta-glucosyltransferase